MGLKISQTTADSVTHPNSYWKIIKAVHEGGNFDTVLKGWHNKQARTDGKQHIGITSVSVNPTITTTSDIRNLLYPLIKDDPFFSGAEDD